MALVTDERRSLFHSYASEFEKKYLLEPDGQRHLALYKKERDEVTRFWSEIKWPDEKVGELLIWSWKNFYHTAILNTTERRVIE